MHSWMCNTIHMTWTLSQHLLCALQGFSERMVTASRPGIGLMFRQVGILDYLFSMHLLLILY